MVLFINVFLISQLLCRYLVLHLSRFSGISEEDVKGNRTSLREVQETLLSFVSADTVLIGHGLETDLCVLKVTAISFLQHYSFTNYISCSPGFSKPSCDYAYVICIKRKRFVTNIQHCRLPPSSKHNFPAKSRF